MARIIKAFAARPPLIRRYAPPSPTGEEHQKPSLRDARVNDVCPGRKGLPYCLRFDSERVLELGALALMPGTFSMQRGRSARDRRQVL